MSNEISKRSFLASEWHRTLMAQQQRPLDRYRIAAAAIREGLGAERRIWIAGGVHCEELAPLTELFSRLKQRHPRLLLVLSLLDSEALGEAYLTLRLTGLRVQRHSDGKGCLPDCDLYLLDSNEELGLFYTAGDVAFVGSTLTVHGTPDPTLPARAGLPLVAGPYRDPTGSHPEIERLMRRLQHSGSLRCGNDTAELVAALDGLLVDGQLGRALGLCAQRCACRATSTSAPEHHFPQHLVVAAGSSRTTPHQGHPAPQDWQHFAARPCKSLPFPL